MINRKGYLFLGEETLKVVIAVLCIALLAYLLYAIYGSGKDSENLEFASESVDFLVQGINSQESSVDIYNPNGWNIGTWPHNVKSGIIFKTTEFQNPRSCSNLGWASCICICEEDSADSCDDKGICVNNEQKFTIVGGNIKIKDPPVILKIDYSTKTIKEE